MKLVKMNCPACAGALELPDNLAVAHCVYCGNKILLDHEGTVQERRDLVRYQELCKVAVEAKNHDDVIRYCNLILEIDPKSIEAWIDKAIATFWLTTGGNNRYDEAMEYLAKAAEIAKDDPRIAKARKEITHQQSRWYNHLGNQRWELALEIFNIHRTTYLFGDGYGKQRSAEQAVEAMNYYLTASAFAPDDIVILKNIAHCAEFYDVVKWSDNVREKIKTLKLVQAKKNAEERLGQARAELDSSYAELAHLKTQKGLFIGGKIKDTERRIRQLQDELANLDRTVAANPVKPFVHRTEIRADPLYDRVSEMLRANENLNADAIARELGIERQRAINLLTLYAFNSMNDKK